MTPEQKLEIVRTAYESFTNEPWAKSGRQEHWENMVDEVNRRPHLTGADSMEEHVRKVYHQVMFGVELKPPVVKPPKVERLAETTK